ncbi:MAG: methyltransferase domain-containing protein [Halobacteriaceae archaeon]
MLPETVTTAIEDVPVGGATCLDAGAGTGNMALALAAAGADQVVTVTDDREHATGVRERVAGDPVDVLEADLRATPVRDGVAEVVTAHALFNVLEPAAAHEVVGELARIAGAEAHLVVVDYAPLPEGVVADLFALENAVATLRDGVPAYTFYPSAMLAAVFGAHGFEHVGTETLLDPVPWSRELLAEHADLAREGAATLDEPLGPALEAEVAAVEARIPEGGVDAGQYYALRFRR